MQATIHNEFLTLTVDTHGAEAVSLKNAAGEEMLWQADPAIWKRHAPILFPWTGKLVDGTFTAKGKTWKGGQHGFARDLEHTLLRAEGDTIQLELRADDAIKAERFPYDFVLTSTFRLEGKTKPNAAHFPAAGLIHPEKGLEDDVPAVCGDARAGICNAQHRILFFLP